MTAQKHAVVEDVLRLLHLYEERGTMRLRKGDPRAEASSLSWRLSMAMELVACPSLLVVDNVPNSGSLHMFGHACTDYQQASGATVLMLTCVTTVCLIKCLWCFVQTVARLIQCIQSFSLAAGLDPFQPALFLDCLNLLAGLGMTIVTTSLPGCAPFDTTAMSKLSQ